MNTGVATCHHTLVAAIILKNVAPIAIDIYYCICLALTILLNVGPYNMEWKYPCMHGHVHMYALYGM